MIYNNKSFIVNGELCLAIVDKRIPWNIENELKKLNIEIIKTIGCSNTYEAIKYHPDISICKLDDANIVVAPNVYEYYKEKLSVYGFNVIKGNSTIETKYPLNIQYNIAILERYAIHNFKYTDKKILEYIEKENLEKIDIKQGYSKCSICIVDENSIITEDKGIANKIKDYDIDCLLVQGGSVKLFDMNYGFIGGSSGLISKDKIAFYGNIKKHPDYEKINNFIESKNKRITCLGDKELLDLGSIIPLGLRKERQL